MKITASLLTSTSASFVCVNQSGCGSGVRNGNDPACVTSLTVLSFHILASSGLVDEGLYLFITDQFDIFLCLSLLSGRLSASASATLAHMCVAVSCADLSARLSVTQYHTQTLVTF